MNSTLEIRSIPIPREFASWLTQLSGYDVTCERRHFLAGHPVHCGEMLEVYVDGDWMLGRYEWTTMTEDEPTLDVGDRVFWLDSSRLLRWPKSDRC